ncbi:MAG: NUDIX hydrolase [Bacteroidetes bacterium]|nr:NUDIX hydrolase [Bacteroidota bacterium]MBS1648276.1 NUDIX hydrolase [Bacteroidota bacterium]
MSNATNNIIPTKFTIRVYGILIDEHKRVLVSDEFIRGNYFTKFPGGGLEVGEGTKDCLKREFKEETNLDIIVGKHIYTTDYYQPSAFDFNDQIISIYYYAHANNLSDLSLLHTKTKPFDFSINQIANAQKQAEVLRWVDWNNLKEETVHLPIDKHVIKILKESE